MSETLTSSRFGLAGAGEAAIYGNKWRAQLVTVEKVQVESIILWIWTDGNLGGGDTGTIDVSIRSVSGGHPDTILSSTTINFADLPTVIQGYPTHDGTTITLDSPLDLEIGQYAIEIHFTEGDAGTHVHWLTKDPGSYTGGNYETSEDAGSSWNTSATVDCCFAVYGQFYPIKPTITSPTDDATGITLDEAILDWDGSANSGRQDSVRYDVYFGEEGSPVLLGTVTHPISVVGIDFGTLFYATTYEWRVDARNNLTTTTGDTWKFTTLTFAPPIASGLNTMKVIKRLVAVAASKFWYEDI